MTALKVVPVIFAALLGVVLVELVALTVPPSTLFFIACFALALFAGEVYRRNRKSTP